MGILNLARVPAVTIEPSASVIRGILLMQKERVGALFVVEKSELVGVFTERDIAFRVVLPRLDAKRTPVRKVMTTPAVTVSKNAGVREAIQVMVEHRVRHLPVVSQGSVKGMISLRHMLRQRASGLTEHMDSVVAGLLADGIGG